MAKQGEIDYLSKLTEAGRQHASNKPFSDHHCADYLTRLASVMYLLPPLPARVLDAGCGTGWTSEFLGRRGYTVVGVDLAPDMIARAEQSRRQQKLGNVSFQVSDYESLPFKEEFEAVLFFDALHHAVDEEAALAAAYRALKRGGRCIACEPGRGHARSTETQCAVAQFGITEKDMPPGKLIRLGRKLGFRTFRVYPHAHDLGRAIYAPSDRFLPRGAARWGWARRLVSLVLSVGLQTVRPLMAGTVVMVK